MPATAEQLSRHVSQQVQPPVVSAVDETSVCRLQQGTNNTRE